MWDFLANLSFEMDYVILFCFGKTHYRIFFFFFFKIFVCIVRQYYFVENKYVMREFALQQKNMHNLFFSYNKIL